MIEYLVIGRKSYLRLRPSPHDAGTKLCRHNAVCNCSHDAGSMSVSSLFLNFTLITVDNIYHSQNVSSNRNETLTVTCSHRAETVEFCYGFKLLRLALRFHIFSCRYRVNATPKRKNFVPFSNSAGIVWTGSNRNGKVIIVIIVIIEGQTFFPCWE